MFYYILNKKVKLIYIKYFIWYLIFKILLQICDDNLFLTLIYLNNLSYQINFNL